MRFLIGVLFLGLVTAASGTAAEPRVYTLLGYPKQAVGCLGTAVAMGESLRQATGVIIQRAFCDQDRPDGYDLRIVYVAEEELPLVSTEGKLGYAGTYPTPAACAANLAADVRVFESRTRLKAFLAYCYVDESGLSRTIGTRIDGFGTPAEWPQVLQEQLFAAPLVPRAAEAELTAALRALSLEPSIVAVIPSGEALGGYRVVLKYYGAKHTVFQLRQEQFQYDSPKVCESELAATKALLAAQGLSTASAFCTWDGFHRKAAVSFVAPWDVPWYRGELADDRFPTLAACVAERARLVEFFKVTLKLPVFGAVCAEDRGFTVVPSARQYRAEMLSPCSAFGAAECGRPF